MILSDDKFNTNFYKNILLIKIFFYRKHKKMNNNESKKN